jgi:hypothetical protein
VVHFPTKNPNLGNFWMVLQWKIMVLFMDIWFIVQPFVIFHEHLVYFVVIWYIFPFWYVVPRKIWQPWLDKPTGKIGPGVGYVISHLGSGLSGGLSLRGHGSLQLNRKSDVFAERSSKKMSYFRGCQTAYFPTRNPNLGKFRRDLKWKLYSHLVYFTAIWFIL